jgi:hypothetical protein
MSHKVQVISKLTSLFVLLALALVAIPSFGQLTGTSTMSVKIVDVIQLTVTTPNSLLEFNTAADFKNGVNTTVSNQLNVFSSRSYDLKVKSNAATLTTTDPTNSIPVSNISVEPTNTTGIGTATTLALSATDQTFVNAAPATLGKDISMKYFTAANNLAFMIPGETYSSTLTFTISAH